MSGAVGVNGQARRGRFLTYIVARLFVLVALLVGFGLGLIRLPLLEVEGLPSLAEDFANLTYSREVQSVGCTREEAHSHEPYQS